MGSAEIPRRTLTRLEAWERRRSSTLSVEDVRELVRLIAKYEDFGVADSLAETALSAPRVRLLAVLGPLLESRHARIALALAERAKLVELCPTLRLLLGSRRAEIASVAAEGLGALGSAEDAARIAKLLTRKDDAQAASVAALRRLAKRTGSASAALRQVGRAERKKKETAKDLFEKRREKVLAGDLDAFAALLSRKKGDNRVLAFFNKNVKTLDPSFAHYCVTKVLIRRGTGAMARTYLMKLAASKHRRDPALAKKLLALVGSKKIPQRYRDQHDATMRKLAAAFA